MSDKKDYHQEWEDFRKAGYSPPDLKDNYLEWRIPEFWLKQDISRLAYGELSNRGLSKKVYLDRLSYELDCLSSRGMMEFAKCVLYVLHGVHSRRGLLSPGRGSGCSSLLFYLMGAHSVDPIKWDLSFDYFLPPDRPDKLPDVDLEVYDPSRFYGSYAKPFNGVRASKLEHGRMVYHASGLYFQHMPLSPNATKTRPMAAYPHAIAKSKGFMKIDLLSNRHLFWFGSGLRRRDAYLDLLSHPEFPWDRFVLESLYGKGMNPKIAQLAKWFRFARMYPPKSVDDISVLVALVRPGKKHLQGKSLDDVRAGIWQDDNGGSPDMVFKRPHAVATAMTVCLHMLCLLRNEIGDDYERG